MGNKSSKQKRDDKISKESIIRSPQIDQLHETTVTEPESKHKNNNNKVSNKLTSTKELHIHNKMKPLPYPYNLIKNKIQRLLQLTTTGQILNNFVLKWDHIGNAINQELYGKISLEFMNMVNGPKRYDDTDHLLKELKQNMRVDENEINYIRELTNRAKTFNPHEFGMYCNNELINNLETNYGLFREKLDTLIINELGKGKVLTADIFSVYNCFLFSNFQFQQSDIEDLTYPFEHKVSINLYPQYVIEDDMYSIWKYFFAGSHVINQRMKVNKKMSFIMTIIPNKVISIYDHSVVFPFYNYHTVHAQEFNRNLKFFHQLPNSLPNSLPISFCREISESADVSAIIDLLEFYVNYFRQSSSIQIIIDKRRLKKNKKDTIYIVELNGVNTFKYC
eukprot:384532_1